MNIRKIEVILQSFMSKPIGIQGLILISAEGQPLTQAIGLEQNNALIMAGTMLYLAKMTCDEYNWNGIENIAVKGQQGYLILRVCHDDIFLLLKAVTTVPMGLLEGEINRLVKNLQIELQASEAVELRAIGAAELETNKAAQAKTVESPQLNGTTPPEFTPEELAEPENEVTYRGRRTGL